MTEEETKNETVKIELVLDLLPKQITGGVHTMIKQHQHQHITFTYDKYTKGQRAAMTLTSNNGEGIDAPEHEIYFENDQLESILEFLLKQKK